MWLDSKFVLSTHLAANELFNPFYKEALCPSDGLENNREQTRNNPCFYTGKQILKVPRHSQIGSLFEPLEFVKDFLLAIANRGETECCSKGASPQISPLSLFSIC